MNKQLVVIKNQWRMVLASFVAGAVLAFVIVSSNSNKQIDRLKQYGDSVAVVAQARKVEVNVLNNHVEVAVDSLQRIQNALIRSQANNRKKDAQLDAALDSATTDSSKIVILTEQRDNLREANLTLEQALGNMTMQRDLEFTRAEHNLAKFNEANRTIILLNRQIQGLGPTLPGWVRTGAKVAVVGVAFYAGTRVGK